MVGNIYKFFIFNHIYFNKVDEKFILYDTQSGEYFESDSLVCCKLIEDIFIPENLGVIDIKEEQLIEDVANFINIIVDKKFGKLVKSENASHRIINLLPILNLQTDVDRLKNNQDMYSNNILNYLNELNIYLNEECHMSCPNCNHIFKQIKSCYKDEKCKFLNLDVIKLILDEVSNSLLKTVNILGGNILLFPKLKELISLLDKYPFEFHFWINYKNINEQSILKYFKFKEILVTFPIDKSVNIEFFTKHKQSKFHFIIENDIHFKQIKDFIKDLEIDSTVNLIYNYKNIEFFKEYVFLDKKDIFSSLISHRSIFCNQKLNSNFFGKLYIFPDGSIKANVNSLLLGNIYTNSLLEIIYMELNKNTSWRKIRNDTPCKNCLYQYLCPPPSNYETVIGKSNLCFL